MKVRAAGRTEWRGLWDIEQQCYPAGTAYTWTEFVEALDGCEWVLAAEGVLGVVGFVAVEVDGDRAVIENIAVDPDLRKAGIAAKLVDASASRARDQGCKALRLQVAKRNPAAIAAFEKLGFRTVRTLPGYYTSPAWAGDALEMERPL